MRAPFSSGLLYPALIRILFEQRSCDIAILLGDCKVRAPNSGRTMQIVNLLQVRDFPDCK